MPGKGSDRYSELRIRTSEDGLTKGKGRVLQSDRRGLKPQFSHLLVG